MLIASVVKAAIQETLEWSQDKTEDEWRERAEREEDKTKKLMERMRGG